MFFKGCAGLRGTLFCFSELNNEAARLMINYARS